MLAEAKAIDIYTNYSLIIKKKHVQGKKNKEVFIITVLTKNTYLHTYFNLVVYSVLLS